jgi:hypothetical protein
MGRDQGPIEGEVEEGHEALHESVTWEYVTREEGGRGARREEEGGREGGRRREGGREGGREGRTDVRTYEQQ